jgi:hypothetical protein
MRYLAIIIVIVLSAKLDAQIVPGYQGKKGIVSYQVSISPALTRPTFLNKVRNDDNYPKADESAFVPFNFTHGVVLERVTGRKFSLAFEYNFIATKDYITFTQKTRDDLTGIDEKHTFTNAQIKLFGHYFGGALVFYGKRALAPYGKYFKLNAGQTITYSSFTQASYSTTPTSQVIPSTVYTFNTKGVRYSLPATSIGFGFGTNRIYKNKFVVSRGINLLLMLKPDYTFDSDQNAYDVMFKRMRGHDLLTFYIKIGFLA